MHIFSFRIGDYLRPVHIDYNRGNSGKFRRNAGVHEAMIAQMLLIDLPALSVAYHSPCHTVNTTTHAN